MRQSHKRRNRQNAYTSIILKPGQSITEGLGTELGDQQETLYGIPVRVSELLPEDHVALMKFDPPKAGEIEILEGSIGPFLIDGIEFWHTKDDMPGIEKLMRDARSSWFAARIGKHYPEPGWKQRPDDELLFNLGKGRYLHRD